jgi:hypothetical protein
MGNLFSNEDTNNNGCNHKKHANIDSQTSVVLDGLTDADEQKMNGGTYLGNKQTTDIFDRVGRIEKENGLVGGNHNEFTPSDKNNVNIDEHIKDLMQAEKKSLSGGLCGGCGCNMTNGQSGGKRRKHKKQKGGKYIDSTTSSSISDGSSSSTDDSGSSVDSSSSAAEFSEFGGQSSNIEDTEKTNSVNNSEKNLHIFPFDSSEKHSDVSNGKKNSYRRRH